MNPISNLIRTLNKPFPEENFMGHLKSISFVSVFVFLFLIIFEPFGISDGEGDKYVICAGFAITTFLGMLIYTLLFHLIVKLKGSRNKWTYGKWILYNLGIMVFISLANFLFARLWIFGYIDWRLYPTMMYGTLMIGIIPIMALGAFSLYRKEKKYRQISAEINLQNNSQTRPSLGSTKSILDIPVHQIRYVEALQNYVNIFYVNSEGILVKKTERSTLKKVLEESADSPIMKCHRSYLINQNEINTTSGNAQGLLISLNNCTKEIPVSRSFVSKFRNKTA